MSMDLEISHADSFSRLLEAPVLTVSQGQVQPQFAAYPMTNSLPPATPDASAVKRTTVTSVLKNFTWQPTAGKAEAANVTEAALLQLIDDQLCISSVANVSRLLDLLVDAKTEPERALVLVILRGTALAANAKLAKACIAAFEKRGGVKIAKRWLEEAVEWNHTDLLVLLLEVLKTLPLQLSSITQAKINEPIVNLRKSGREEKVRRSAQDLLKFWRNKFTEKAKAPAKEPAPVTAAAPAQPAKPASSGTLPTTTAAAASSSATPTVSVSAVAKPAPTDGSPSKLGPVKRRTIKRLERLPFGGGAAVSKSSDLIGNLMQRKSAKDAAAAAAAAAAKPKSDSLVQKLSGKEISSKSESKASSPSASTASKSPPPAEAKDEMDIQMTLPTIQSFNAATATAAASKKIRWADEDGKELVKVKFIESWRDLIMHDPNQSEESFRDAKLREHASERNAMKSHKEHEAFKVAIAHEWSVPALMKLPEALEKRRHAVSTDEVAIQRARTRREMEYLVLDGEVPPPSPKEWEPSANDMQRGSPVSIPLTDVGAPATDAPNNPPVYAGENQQQNYGAAESEEDRALREALGPLKKSTIALLLENEDILPQVYDEAQRNGNRIPDGRVIEILEQRRHQQQQHQQSQRYGPPSSGSAYSSYGGGGGAPSYPPSQQSFNDYSRPPPQSVPMAHSYQQQSQQQPPPHMFGKRKAPGAGNFPEGPVPPKRKKAAFTLPCIYFPTPSGCKHGNACLYIHDYNSLPTAPGGNSEYTYHGGGGGGGGRFGHQQHSGGMRGGGMGGGGMRHIRGGR